MIYASALALGFAAIESLTYILRSYDVGVAYHLSPSSAAHLALTMTAPVRALVGNLGHLVWTGVIGYAYGRWRCGMGRRAGLFRSYLGAAGGHGAYDALLGLHATVLAFSLLALGVMLYVHLFRRALTASPVPGTHQLRSPPTSTPPVPPRPVSSPTPSSRREASPPGRNPTPPAASWGSCPGAPPSRWCSASVPGHTS